jgi:hypothetical protein
MLLVNLIFKKIKTTWKIEKKEKKEEVPKKLG